MRPAISTDVETQIRAVIDTETRAWDTLVRGQWKMIAQTGLLEY